MNKKYTSLAITIGLAAAVSASAQTLTYTGGSNIWGQSTAWGGTAYADNRDIVFGASGFTNPSTLLSGAPGTTRTVSSVSFNNNAGPGNSVTIATTTSGILHINSGGISALSGAASQTFSNTIDVDLNASQSWSNSGVGTLLFNSRITGSASNDLSLTQGSFQFTNANNDFAGDLAVSNATLSLNNGGALARGNITIGSSGTLQGGIAFGELNYSISGALGDTTIVASGGTFALSNLDLVVAFDSAPTLSAYTIVDASGGGSITGGAFNSVDLPTGWFVQYNADSIVVVPEASQFALLLSLTAIGVVSIRRRRKV